MKKQGRPKRLVGEVRNQRLSIRFTKTEFEKLKKVEGETFSDKIRNLLNNYCLIE